MEPKWLIRTSQNQILGPVAKGKLLEFLQKGALGQNDEVASGNGYWFSLREKELVDKYLHGDVPQGYNPISESKSVLSRRDNPDKTTSINTSPANKTQVLKFASLGPGVLPNNDDLEYPDVTLIKNSVAEALTEQVKLPTQDDLAFPDITLITTYINNNPNGSILENRPIDKALTPGPSTEATISSESVVYPKDDDLAFPEIEPSRTQAEEDRDFTIIGAPLRPKKPGSVVESIPEPVKSEEKKKSVKDFKYDLDDDSGLTLIYNTAPEDKAEKVQKVEQSTGLLKKAKSREAHLDDRKKTKVTLKENIIHEIHEESVSEKPKRGVPEHLKKRNDNYLLYVLVILVLIIFGLFFYYYNTILNKPLPV